METSKQARNNYERLQIVALSAPMNSLSGSHVICPRRDIPDATTGTTWDVFSAVGDSQQWNWVFCAVGAEAINSTLVIFQTVTRVEAGSNTSTMTLRVVGGDEKGSLKTETVKYGRGIQGTRTWERLGWRGPAAYTKDRPVLSSERAPHKNKTVTIINIWSWAPDGARHQDLLIDRPSVAM
jgi:hypothetical protein